MKWPRYFFHPKVRAHEGGDRLLLGLAVPGDGHLDGLRGILGRFYSSAARDLAYGADRVFDLKARRNGLREEDESLECELVGLESADKVGDASGEEVATLARVVGLGVSGGLGLNVSVIDAAELRCDVDYAPTARGETRIDAENPHLVDLAINQDRHKVAVLYRLERNASAVFDDLPTLGKEKFHVREERAPVFAPHSVGRGRQLL